MGVQASRSGWALDGLILAAGAAAVVGSVYADQDSGDALAMSLVSYAVTLSYVVAGVVARHRRGRHRLALPMVAAGLSWDLPNQLEFAGAPQWLVFDSVFVFHLCVVILLLTYPAGRVRGRIERWTVRGSVVVFIVFHAALYPIHGTRLFDAMVVVESALQDAVYVTVVVLLARRWRHSTPAVRRALTPLWAAGVLAGISAMPLASLRPWTNLAVEHRLGTDESASVLRVFFDAENVASIIQLLIPLCFLFGLVRASAARAAVADLVLDLESGAEPAAVRAALARALGDPTLQVYYWVPRGVDDEPASVNADRRGQFVAQDGTPTRLEPLPAGQAVSVVEGSEGRLAALVYDRELLAQPGLLRAVLAAARLALDNARLQAQLLARLAEMRQSRARLVEAALEERRRVERDLHDGAQQRLLALGLTVTMMRDRLLETPDPDPQLAQLVDEAAGEVHASITELRELARGIHPAVLTTHGLGAAVAGLVQRCAVPVTVDIPPERWSERNETAAYFLISEALVNVTKHARAGSAIVRVRPTGNRLQVSVCDDGIGGVPVDALPGTRPGGGLPGLADRVAALGGSFQVISRPGEGTTLTVEFPCD